MAARVHRVQQLVMLLVAVAPAVGLGDQPRPAVVGQRAAGDAASRSKKPDAQAKTALARKAEQVAELFRAVVKAIETNSRRAAPVVEADPELVVQHYVAQFTPQFRPLLATELYLVRTVCQPTPQQLRTIKAAGDARLASAVRKYAEVHKEWWDRDYRDDRQLVWPDVRKLIVDGLTESVRKTLSSDQAKRYELNIEQRAAARKRVALLCLVSKLDQDLLLSAEQRDKLTEALKSNWQDTWAQNLEALQHGSQFAPMLPDEQVLPILSAAQAEIWNGTKKRRLRNYGWTGFGFVQPLEEEPEQAAETEEAPDKGAEKAKEKTEKKP